MYGFHYCIATYGFHYWERLKRNRKKERKCKVNMLTSTHWAALPRHTDEVNTWRQTVYFRAGGHTIHAHTCHTWS